MGRNHSLNRGERWSLGRHGVLLHPFSEEAPYGWVKVAGIRQEKTDVFRLHRTIDGTGTYYPEDQPGEFSHSLIKFKEDTQDITSVSNDKDLFCGNQFAVLRENGVVKKTVVSWWHSPHGDAPLSDYSQTFVADGEPRFDFPPEAIPYYVPFVKDINSSADDYRARLMVNTPLGLIVVLPQLYVNGKLAYVHGDASDPQGYFCGAHVVSPRRVLAIYVQSYNQISTIPGFYPGRVIRLDQSYLLDINLSTGTVAQVMTLNNGVSLQDEDDGKAWSLVLNPYRFSEDGSKLSILYRVKDIYYTYSVSPISNPKPSFIQDGEVTFLAEFSITYNDELDTFSGVKTSDSFYQLRAVGSLSWATTLTTNTTDPLVYEGFTTTTHDYSLSGDKNIPYAVNYIDNARVLASIVFSETDDYNDSYQSHEMFESEFVDGHYIHVNDRKPQVENPTLDVNGTTYVLGTDGGYREFNYGGDGSSAGNDSYAEESAVIGVDYYLEFIDLVKGVTVFANRSADHSGRTAYRGSAYASNTPGIPIDVNYESVSVVNKMDFMSINGAQVFSNGATAGQTLIEHRVGPVDVSGFDPGWDEIKYGFYLYSYLDSSTNSHSLPFDGSSAFDYSLHIDDYLVKSIFSASSFAVDHRCPEVCYAYCVHWPEASLYVENGIYDPIPMSFPARDHHGSTLIDFLSNVASLPGLDHSFNTVGII